MEIYHQGVQFQCVQLMLSFIKNSFNMCEQVLMVFLELVQRMNLIGVAEGNFDILSPAGSPNNLSLQEIAPHCTVVLA